MAMNRMYLRCRHCGDKFLLAKAGGIRFEQPFEPVSYSHNLNDFLEQHYECKGRNDVGYDFDICYSDPEWSLMDSDTGKPLNEVFKSMSDIQQTAMYKVIGLICPAGMRIFTTDLNPDQREKIQELYGKFVLENNGIGRSEANASETSEK